MKRYSVRFRENGAFIDSSDSLDVVFSMMESYIIDDLEEFGKETDDDYEIYDNEKECVLDCWKGFNGEIKFIEL